ncbi:MAG: SEC-C domain-containing protein [Deltaproteobacteria bacterium]|nr:SEC-C domain-containing protein [Deltaproteobacteria bacterium]
MKHGRNDPCPCGSGKKYKKCCLNAISAPVDLLYRRLSETHNRLVDRLMDYAAERFEDMAVAVAMAEFLVWPDEAPGEDFIEQHQQLFWPWFCFNWINDPEDTPLDLHWPVDQTIAESYAESQKDRLDSMELKLITAHSRRPFSFFEVVECRPGKGFLLKDIFTGEQTDVLERSGSESTHPGDILFGQVIKIDHVGMLISSGQFLIPPRLKPELIQFRKWLKQGIRRMTTDILSEHDCEIREIYFDLVEILQRPAELFNTDGDPLIFHTLYYKIESPDPAFERLHTLCGTDTADRLRSEAKLDAKGHILRVEIPWSRKGNKRSKALENTLLGHLIIDGNRLTVEVNSAQRAEVAREKIDRLMGKAAIYKTTEIRSLDSPSVGRKAAGPDSETAAQDQNALMQDPEVRRHIGEMLAVHWQGWVDQNIPALNGETPRQAVKTTDGRESVMALLLDAELHMAADPHMSEAGVNAINKVRRELGLERSLIPPPKKARSGDKARQVAVIQEMIRAFGQKKLNDMYTDLALKLCEKIGRMRKLSIQRGRQEIWAAAIVYAMARINFLFDPTNEVYITADDICDFFGTKKSTVGNKAGQIQKTCDVWIGDSEISNPEIAEMFTSYETPEGFIIPASLLRDQDNTFDSAEPDASSKTKTSPNRPKQKKSDASSKKESRNAGDRQLKLFDD